MTVSVAIPRVPTTTDAVLSGTSSAVVPMFGGMANFEPSAVEWHGLTTRSAFGGVTVE